MLSIHPLPDRFRLTADIAPAEAAFAASPSETFSLVSASGMPRFATGNLTWKMSPQSSPLALPNLNPPLASTSSSPVSVNEFLSRLLLLQCQGRIPPRRAAVMAYTCNLLLHTLPAIDRENPIPDDAQQTVIWDIPGLDPVRGSDPAYPQSSELTHDVHANEDASSITR